MLAVQQERDQVIEKIGILKKQNQEFGCKIDNLNIVREQLNQEKMFLER